VKTSVFLRGSFFRMNSETQINSKLKRQLGKKQLKELGLRNSPPIYRATLSRRSTFPDLHIPVSEL